MASPAKRLRMHIRLFFIHSAFYYLVHRMISFYISSLVLTKCSKVNLTMEKVDKIYSFHDLTYSNSRAQNFFKGGSMVNSPKILVCYQRWDISIIKKKQNLSFRMFFVWGQTDFWFQSYGQLKWGSSKKSDAFLYNSYTVVCKNAHPAIFSKFT